MLIVIVTHLFWSIWDSVATEVNALRPVLQNTLKLINSALTSLDIDFQAWTS